MTRKEHLLTILSEECNEVAQRVSKALRFSLEEVQPEQKLNNAERILEEFYDLLAVAEMLRDEEHLPTWSVDRVRFYITAKQQKIEKYLLHSKANGTLNDDAEEKAKKWDAFQAKIGKFYEDGSEADLVDIGEAAAQACGYL